MDVFRDLVLYKNMFSFLFCCIYMTANTIHLVGIIKITTIFANIIMYQINVFNESLTYLNNLLNSWKVFNKIFERIILFYEETCV